MSTSHFYNRNALDHINGTHTAGKTYKVMLLSGAVFDATHTTLAQVVAAATGGEVTGGGVAAGGITLTGVAATQVGSGAKFTAADVSHAVTGTVLGPFNGYLLYNATATDSPPLMLVLLAAAMTVAIGQPFDIHWPAAGISDFPRV